MKIRVYNVKHGDFILIGLDNNILITRDFGSLDSYVNKCIENRIGHCYYPLKKFGHYCHFIHCCQLWDFIGDDFHHEAILTHPHKDHYSGYETMYSLGLRKIYDRAYVPYLDLKHINSTPSFHSQLLKTALCFIVAMSSTKTSNVQEWIKVAPLMSSLSKKLIGVYQGCNALRHWQPKGTVLWPPLPSDSYYNKRKKNLDDMLDSFSKNVKEQVDSIYGELSDLLSSLFDDDDFNGYDDVENKNDIDYYQKEDQCDVFAKVNDLLEKISGKFSNECNPDIEKMYKKFGVLIDDHSVAFSIDSTDKSALFLSDFHDNAMNRMVGFMKNPNFKFIKSAHHGTRLGKKLESYLSSAPLAESVVHCCGPSKSNYYGPLVPYSSLGNNIYCTDWNSKSAKWKMHHSFIIFKHIYKDFVL